MACGLPHFHKRRKWLVTGIRIWLVMSYVTSVMNGCLLVGANLSLTIIANTIYLWLLPHYLFNPSYYFYLTRHFFIYLTEHWYLYLCQGFSTIFCSWLTKMINYDGDPTTITKKHEVNIMT